MKVLITGSSGIIGRAMTEALLARGDEVVAFDLAATDLTHPGLTAIAGDVRQYEQLRRASIDCDSGLHLAVKSGDTEELELFSTNTAGAYAFLMAARDNGFRQSVVAGSAPVHLPAGGLDLGLINTASEADAYDLSKSVQEMIAADFHQQGLPVICLRFGHVVYGAAEQNLDTPTPLAALDYCVGGWVALEDVVQGCIAALDTGKDDDFRSTT